MGSEGTEDFSSRLGSKSGQPQPIAKKSQVQNVHLLTASPVCGEFRKQANLSTRAQRKQTEQALNVQHIFRSVVTHCDTYTNAFNGFATQ